MQVGKVLPDVGAPERNKGSKIGLVSMALTNVFVLPGLGKLRSTLLLLPGRVQMSL